MFNLVRLAVYMCIQNECMIAIDARLCRHMYIVMFRISMSILYKLFANYIGILVQDIISF